MKKSFIIISFILTCKLIFAQAPVYLSGFPLSLDSTYQPIWYGVTPIVADFDKDGNNEILFCLHKPRHNRVYLIKSDGSALNGWPVTINYDRTGLPAIAAGDVNNDGFLDVVLRDRDSLWVIKHDGSYLSGFPVYYLHDKLAQVALYDLNNDGFLEIITQGVNYINVFDHNGNVFPGWPRRLPGIPEDVFTPPPSIADLDNDGFGEIIINSSETFAYFDPQSDSNYTHIFRYDGTYFPGWPVHVDSNYSFYSQPATIYKDHFTDTIFILNNSARYFPPNFPFERNRFTRYRLDGSIDYRLNIDADNSPVSSIATAFFNNEYFFAFGSEAEPIYMIRNASLAPNWPVFGNGYFYNSPLIAEMNSELRFVTYIRTIDFGTLRSWVYFYNIDGSQPSWSPLRPLGIPAAAGVFCDINKDGQLDYSMLTYLDTNNVAHSILHVWTFPGVSYNPQDLHWPMYGHDRYRTNQYGFIPPDEPVGIQPVSTTVPQNFQLYQNNPNPFNPSTTITFSLPTTQYTRLTVFDILGREVAVLVNEKLNAGTYNFQLSMDSYQLKSGVYFYKLEAGEFVQTRKMVLVK